jgi:hypothetical protein
VKKRSVAYRSRRLILTSYETGRGHDHDGWRLGDAVAGDGSGAATAFARGCGRLRRAVVRGDAHSGLAGGGITRLFVPPPPQSGTAAETAGVEEAGHPRREATELLDHAKRSTVRAAYAISSIAPRVSRHNCSSRDTLDARTIRNVAVFLRT